MVRANRVELTQSELIETDSERLTPRRVERLRKPYPIYVIIALAFALQLHGLAADSFWGDEILTAMLAAGSPAKIIARTAGDIHPPLYYFVSRSFVKFSGLANQPGMPSDWVWRFPSVLAVMITIAMTYSLTRHLLRQALRPPPKNRRLSELKSTSPRSVRVTSVPLSGANYATATCLLLSVSPVLIKYGQEARMHALFMMWAIGSTCCLIQATWHSKPSWQRYGWWGGFIITATASLYTVYFGFLILAAQALFVFGFSLSYDLRKMVQFCRLSLSKSAPTRSACVAPISQKNGLKSSWLSNPLTLFVVAVIVILTLYGPWWPVLLRILWQRAVVGTIEGGVGNPLTFLIQFVESLAPFAWGFWGLFLLGLGRLAFNQNWSAFALSCGWVGLPALLPLLLGDPRALQFRYAFIGPIYLLVVVYGLGWLTQFRLMSLKNRQALFRYAVWVLITLSLIGTIGIYRQTKPDWRQAADYLESHAHAGDIILHGPLWDEGRFINYYYQGGARLLPSAPFVANIEPYAEGLRRDNGRIWAINRFAPQDLPLLENIDFSGVIISEAQLNVYEPNLLREVAVTFARQAVDAAYPWAEHAAQRGLIDPDPQTTKAGALRNLGDTLLAVGQLDEAIAAYQEATTLFPASVGTHLALAEAYQQQHDWVAAAKSYQQAIRFNPAWQGQTAEQAAALIATQDWQAAITLYHQLVKDDRFD